MDEINEKAIKDIIDYYDNVKDVQDTSEESQTEEVPALVDIIEAHAEKQEKKETSETVKEEPTEQSDAEIDEAEPDIDEENEFDAEAVKEELTEEAQEQSEEKPEVKLTLVTDLAEDEDDIEPPHPKKNKKWLIAVVMVLITALVTVFITVDTGFIGTYKKNASKNVTFILDFFGIDISHSKSSTNKGLGKVPKFRSSVKDTVTVPMENAGRSVFAEFRGSIVCAYTNYLTLINNDGTTVWENTTTIVNPILKTAGNYILLAEKGGKKICLYNDSRLVYEADTEDNILNCSLSSSGDVAAVTDKPSYKGAVVVYNREGNKIFAWSSGSDNIISADISSVSRSVAVALLNTDDRVRSTVQLFDINEPDSFAQVIFEETIIFHTAFNGDTLSVFGDNGIAGITSEGKLIYDKRFDGAEFVHYGVDGAGNKVLLFDNSNIPLINIYDLKGELKNQISPEELPDFVDISGKYIFYNNGRDIIFGKLGARSFKKYTASMDIKELMMLSDNMFAIVYSNNIEIVKV